MSRFTFVAALLGVVGGVVIGTSHENLDHIRELLTKSFSAQVAIASANGQHIKCGPLASLLPGVREQEIDSAANGESPVCGK